MIRTELDLVKQQHTLVLPGTLLVALACGAQDASYEPEAFSGITRDGGRLLGIAPSYRAEFRRGGVLFTPALGKATAENMPLSLTIESVLRADGTVVHRASRPPEPVADLGKARVSYQHGPLATEHYDVRAAGLEQSFVFPTPLPGRGDLAVRLRVDTELDAENGLTEAVSFECPAGGVHLGAITGVDALGRRTAGSYRVEGNAIELRLPGEFVDHATYPLVLDPLIGTHGVISGNNDALNPDGAYDETNDVYLAAFEVRYSALDADVFAARLAPDGSNLGVITVAASPDLEVHPAVANVNASDRFLVVWQQAASPFGVWNLHGRAVSAVGVQSAPVALAPSTANQTGPDLAGDAVTGSNAVLVWQERGAGILAMSVAVLATGDPAPSQMATVTADPTAKAPVITKSGGEARRGVVAWVEEPSPGTGQIVARMINAGGFPISADLNVGPAEQNLVEARLDVDGDGTDFLLAFDRRQNSASGGRDPRDAFAQKLQWDGTALAQVGSPLVLANDSNFDEAEPHVAFLRTKYLVVWLREHITTGTFRLTHAVFSPDCRVCGSSGDVGSGGGASHDAAPAIASQWAGGAIGDEAMILFGHFQLSLPFTGEVRAQRFDAMLGGPMTLVHPGCGNGGAAGTNGPFALGNRELEFTLSGADPASTFAGLGLSFGAPPLPCGSCRLMPPAALFFTVPSAGAASVPFPLPCNSQFLGIGLEFQWLLFGVGGAPCPTTPTLASSDWLRVVLGR